MSLKNTGTGVLTDTKFSASKPEGWLVSFKPERIGSMAPGNSEGFEVNIKPDPKAKYDNYYQVTLVAEASQTRKTMSISVFVAKPEGAWLWVGAGVVFLVVVAFTVIFLRFGRR